MNGSRRAALVGGTAAVAAGRRARAVSAPDTWFGPHTAASAILNQGGKDWYPIIADDTFGHSLEAEATRLIVASGGRMGGLSRRVTCSR
jgi:hypothetical protein